MCSRREVPGEGGGKGERAGDMGECQGRMRAHMWQWVRVAGGEDELITHPSWAEWVGRLWMRTVLACLCYVWQGVQTGVDSANRLEVA